MNQRTKQARDAINELQQDLPSLDVVNSHSPYPRKKKKRTSELE